MDEKQPDNVAAEPHEGHHHRSARERQRRGPMWGCLKTVGILAITFTALLGILIVGSYWYLGTADFAELVRLRIERTLESRLGRNVSIGRVEIIRDRPQRVIIRDLRIANSPGAVNSSFASVDEIDIVGGVDSFWGRKIKVDRVDIRNPRMNIEIYPDGAPLVHNFPRWQPGPKNRWDIYQLTIGTLFVDGGAASFIDRRHDINALATGLTAQISIRGKGVYEGAANSPKVTVRIQDYVPFDVDLRGGFRYAPGVLALNSVALRGRNIEARVSGRFDPLSEGVYHLRVRSQVGLDRVRDIFRVDRVLDGAVALDLSLRGKGGDFILSGEWNSPKVLADVYGLTAVGGRLTVNGHETIVDVEKGQYGGGTIAAHYVLPKYQAPYPMSVDLKYNGISLEKLFNDWSVADTGLRGGATGHLLYHWNKDRILAGGGEGTATLARITTAFSNAKYPLPLGGSADFALANGVVKFRRAELNTAASRVDFTGSLRIEDINTDLAVQIHSTDFSELDRAGFNFAHSAGKKTYTLLGLGGAGDITGTIKGPIKTPQVAAHINAAGTKFNNADLGNSEIDLRYEGVKGVLTFDSAVVREAGGRLALTGTVAFPDRGPSPQYDLAIDAAAYPAERAMSAVTLPFKGIHGAGTGRLTVAGNEDTGRVAFADLAIVRSNSQLRLNGDVQWLPGKGTSLFNLDIATRSLPADDIVAFLDLGTFPATGEVTGTLHLEGTAAHLQGAGAVTVRNGSIYGEPADVVTGDIAFIKGKLRATNVSIAAPAGQLKGEAEIDQPNNSFSYTVQSGSLDPSKSRLLQSVSSLIGGKLTLSSSGAGTFEHPELVASATFTDATLRGLPLPPGTPPPQIYMAIRNGQLIVRGSAGDFLAIDGNGTIGANSAVSGLVKIVIRDLAKVAALSPSTATLPISGRIETDLQIGGSMSSLESLRIDGTMPVFEVRMSEHDLAAARPIRFGIREGQFVFDEFQLQHLGDSFAITGSAELTGAKRLDINMGGKIEAALAQLFVQGLRAEGHVDVALGLAGTLSQPRLTGTVEAQGAQFRFAGFPQVVDQVTGTLIFREDRVEIEALRATVGGGTVVVGGSIAVAGLKPQSMKLSLKGTNVTLRYFEGLTIEGSFLLSLSGDLDRMTLQGDLDVGRAVYSRDFDFGTALLNVVLARRTVTPVVSATWQDRVSLVLHVNAKNALTVHNNIAEVTGSCTLDVRGTLANPAVIGLVTLNEGGRVRMQNVDYRVVSGSINFQNPFRIDPYFDITLEGRMASVGYSEFEQGGTIDVTINLTGTIDRFTPTITSDPPASDVTLFSLLGFGALTNRTGGTAGSPAVGLVGQSLIAQSLLRNLPFAGSLTYDPGLLDATEDPGAKVMFQRQVSPNLRILVIYNLQHPHTRSLLEWQATPDWTLQLTRDEVRSEYRVEARFRRRYEGHWTWGGMGRPIAFSSSVEQLALGGRTTLHASPPAPGSFAGNGPVITQVSYRADAAFDTSVLAAYLSLRVGQPLSIRAVQSSIRNLFATGEFRDIRVETAPSGSGIAVTFVLSLNFRIGEIRIDGLIGKELDRAGHAMTVHVGDVLSLNAVDRSAVAIQQELEAAGYLDATVDPETQFHRERSRAGVILHVNAGPQAKIAAVSIDGNVAPFAAASLKEQMKRGATKTFDLQQARNDADRMERFMVRNDYRKAAVRYLGYDRNAGTVALRYSATAGPRVRVEVTGVTRGAVRGVLPFAKNQAYSEDSVGQAAEDIVRLFQRRGYFNATVDPESGLQPDNTWLTTFHVKPGQRLRLTSVNFTGNRRFSEKQLRDVITTAPKSGFRAFLAGLFRRDGVTRAQLESDRDTLESFYRLHGFSDAQVGSPVVNTQATTGTMTVDCSITEGPQTVVRAVRREGNLQVPADKLPHLQVKAGDPLNPQQMHNDIVALQSFYAERGNAEAQITPRADISQDKTSATLTYVIAEGPKIKTGDIIVRGNTYTHSKVVIREADLAPGEPFAYTRILEAQRNLYRLGIFERAEVQPEQVGTAADQRNIVLQVQEGKVLTLSGSVGVTKQSLLPLSLLGTVSVANRNLFGTGRYLGLDLVGSSNHERREAFLTYREPFVGPYNVPVTVNLFQSDERRPSAHIRQSGTSIEAVKLFGLQTRWSIRTEYRNSQCIPEKAGDLCSVAAQAIIPGVDRTISNSLIADITPTVFWDRRDDPIDPHRGFFASASVEYAFPVFAAHTQFLKEYGQVTYYLPLTTRTVFAVSSRLGFIQGIRSTATAACVDNDSCIPLTERFTGGGESSHRAYALDLLGDLCEDITRPGCKPTLVRLGSDGGGSIAPIGGRSIFITNLEYRFPLFASVGGALFTDFGNIFADSTPRLNDLRYGLGAGIRYLSPVGPLRFDIGYKLHRRSYEKPFAYFVTLGYAF